jgi:ketosteroid isomerase-like protein
MLRVFCGPLLAAALVLLDPGAASAAPERSPLPPMTDTDISLVQRFFDAVAKEDEAAVRALILPDARVRAMFNPNGDTGPDAIRVFPMTAYFEVITRNYDNIVFRDPVYSVADDGRTVWVEARGDRVVTATGQPYRNGYLFRLKLQDGRIAALDEWVNTVTLTRQGIAAQPSR